VSWLFISCHIDKNMFRRYSYVTPVASCLESIGFSEFGAVVAARSDLVDELWWVRPKQYIVLKHDSIFQAHQKLWTPSNYHFFGLNPFSWQYIDYLYIWYILRLEKNDLFLENQVFGKRIGKNQSRGLPGIYSTSYPSWGDVGHIFAFLAHLRVTIPTQ